MKKILFATIATVTSILSFAQYGEGKVNVFKVNMLSPLVRTGSVFYERKLSEKSSAQIGLAYTGFNRESVKINGLVITPEYRLYLSESKSALEGFYIGPYLRYQNLKFEDDFENKATLNSFGGGVLAGHQWIFSNIVSLDIFLGPNYNAGDIKVSQGSDDIDVPSNVRGFGLRFGVTLGITF